MNKEMKKNKMFLALAVVAAFAMVSVSGAALLSDDSDAAILNNPMGSGDNSTTIVEDATELNAKFYINLGVTTPQPYGVQYIKFKDPSVAVSGTITIGTVDDSAGTNFVPYATVTLSEVKNAVFTLLLFQENGQWFGVILVGDEATVDGTFDEGTVERITDYKPAEGTVEVTKGVLMPGAIRPGYITSATWPSIFVTPNGFSPLAMYEGNGDTISAPAAGAVGRVLKSARLHL
jgi:hypothetical protein